ncbi:capsular polysaccharide biosynthesis protein [Rhodococcus sp. LBL1]|nr:capsular polysaccharide biosynthesis protein [Rhodococcus sp. LBL1]MDH6681474.1 capsular polysaccharide biosynthesis protein [Rhodococcus sp. LBL2]
MALSDYLGVVRRRWMIVVATAVACLAIAAAYAASIPTTYAATSRLFVSMATGTSVNDSYQGGLASQLRITSYPYVATGPTVAERVIQRLGLDISPAELQSRITTSFPPATTLLDISVTDSTPEGARVLANTVADEFAQLVGEMETTVNGAAPAARATVIDQARTPTAPSGPNTKRLLAVGLIIGLGLGLLIAFLRDRLDRTIRTSEQLARAISVPVVATLSSRDPEATKDIGRLRARIAAARGDHDRIVVMLTSFTETSSPSVAICLANALADTGARVALIDADTSDAGVSAMLDMQSYPGVAESLRGEYPDLSELPRSQSGVSVVPVGSVDVRTADLLTSARFAEVLHGIGDGFDYVLVAVAPVLADAAALSLSTRCDTSVAVVELGTTPSPRVQAASEAFASSGSPLMGAVAVAQEPRSRFQRPTKSKQSNPDPVPDPDPEPEADPDLAPSP